MVYPNCFIAAGKEYADMDCFVSAPYFRKMFKAESVKYAEITIGAAGFYKLFLNGNDITKGELAPYINNPNDIVYYDKYNVTDYIKKDDNVIVILLGNGFQNNPGGSVWDFDKAIWRGAPKFAMRLDMVAADGSISAIESDESFAVINSPIMFDDYRCGEYYDARLEINNLYNPEFDDSKYKRAIRVSAPNGEKKICEADPIRVYKQLHPLFIAKNGNTWIYDFGENNTGVCKLAVNGQAGQKITIRYGELLKNNELYLDNIHFPQQSAMQKDFVQKSEYTCKEGFQTHIPSFIYNGFRYVSIEGITDEQATEDLLTYLCFSSDFSDCGDFVCSDDIANKLQEATRRSDRSCFIYFPNDCPQREKNGWTADAALSCEQLLLNFNVEKSLTEWLRNIVKSQNVKGEFPGIIPTGGWGFAWGNGPAWDQVIVELPYRIYQYRGTKKAMEICAPAIFRYILYIASKRKSDGLIEFGLGDWCGISYNDSPQAPLIFTDSIISMEIFRKAAFIFKTIGCDSEYKIADDLYNDMRQSIRNGLLDFSSMTAYGNCQTTQAMAIRYGAFDDEEKVPAFEKLLEMINTTDQHMAVGVLGGRVLFHVLSEFGKADLAYEMITRMDFPSYGNWIKRGATTLWEAFHPENGPVLSQNHHFWGDISNWFISSLAGIKVNPYLNDINYIEIKPNFVEKLNNVSAWHNTPCGKISVQWKRNGETIELHIKADKKLHGKITLPSDRMFSDGECTKQMKTGSFMILKKL